VGRGFCFLFGNSGTCPILKYLALGANRISFSVGETFNKKTAKRFFKIKTNVIGFFGMEAAAYKLSMTETPKKPKE